MTSVAVPAPAHASAPSRALASVRRNLLTLWAVLAFAYILLPIAVVILTLDHWREPFAVPGLRESLAVSLQIAALASVTATILGTLIALALVRYAFRGRGSTNLLIFLPMTTPEVVLGASLLALFLNLGVATGFWTIISAHVMFCISFVVVTVRARVVGFDRHLEEAAMDLGANAWTTFRKVTLPIIAPGIVAGALIAFALSLDDFVITNFNAGAEVTFPLYVWGAARVGVPPQVNVIGTMIFLVAVLLMLADVLVQRRRGT